jgi:hypothetical protein
MEKNTKIIIGIVLLIIISWGLVFFIVGSVLILYSIPTEPSPGYGIIDDPFPTSIGPLSLYATHVELEQGDLAQVAAIVFNDQGDAAEYTFTTEMSTRNEHDLDCYIADSADITDTFTIQSGLTEDEIIVIQDTGNTNLGLYVCNVELYREDELISDTSIAIEVI